MGTNYGKFKLQLTGVGSSGPSSLYPVLLHMEYHEDLHKSHTRAEVWLYQKGHLNGVLFVCF